MKNHGMTLIEVLVYASLLSFLISGFIKYSHIIHEKDFHLQNEIQDKQNL